MNERTNQSGLTPFKTSQQGGRSESSEVNAYPLLPPLPLSKFPLLLLSLSRFPISPLPLSRIPLPLLIDRDNAVTTESGVKEKGVSFQVSQVGSESFQMILKTKESKARQGWLESVDSLS